MVSDSSRWLVRHSSTAPARLRLFCLPHAGGGASLFSPWAGLLPEAVELNAIQLPGRENRLREQPWTELKPLVEALAGVLRPHLDLPFAILGYSFGALLAFELARHWRRAGAPMPQHLFVLARRAPQVINTSPPVHQFSDDQLADWMRRLGGTSELILEHPELLPIFLPILRADLTLHETYSYRPEAPLALPISAFGGLADSQAGPEEMERWREQTSGAYRRRLYPGKHFFVKDYQAMLLQDLSQDLSDLAEY
jgi:medium-chain acyl-[acyl-carrier-protein] hydrolase